jgi:hypothetical protein
MASPGRRALARATAALAALGLTATSLVALAGPAAAAGADFEIDGNQITESGVDWQTLDNVSVVTDAIGNAEQAADPQTYFGPGDQEHGHPKWTSGGTPPSGKSDIGNVLVSGEIDDAFHQWLYLGWDRVAQSGQGTGRYYVELNQADTTGQLAPDRTAGDLRIVVADRGNQGHDCQTVDVWNGSAWVSTDCSGFEVGVNTTPIADFFDSPVAENGMIGANRFVETKIDLTELGVGGLCPAAGFSTVHLRSQEGNHQGENGKLKDDASGPIDVPSLCAELTILKQNEDGEALAGATFEISPNPVDPDGEDPLSVTTGEDGTVTLDEIGEDAWGEDFTVTETIAPEGYLLPAERSRTVTFEPGGTVTLTFVDPRPWKAPTVDVTGEADMTVTHDWSIVKEAAQDEVTVPDDQDSVELSYEIVVTEGATTTESSRSVTVSVTNPNDAAMNGTLDVTMNGEPCTVDDLTDAGPDAEGLQVELAPGETTSAVTCATEELGGTVTATVTWDRGTYPMEQGDVDSPEDAPLGTATDSAQVEATTTHVNASVDVYDDFVNPDEEPELLGTVDTQGEGTTTAFQLTRSVDVERGACLDVVNDSYVVADGDELDRDSATVTVCLQGPPTTVPPTEPQGPTEPSGPALPVTGASIALGVLGALLLAGTGLALLAWRRRVNS